MTVIRPVKLYGATEFAAVENVGVENAGGNRTDEKSRSTNCEGWNAELYENPAAFVYCPTAL